MSEADVAWLVTALGGVGAGALPPDPSVPLVAGLGEGFATALASIVGFVSTGALGV